MSRSNPTESTPNPAVRWFEWNGEHGVVRYYDKDAKKNIDVGTKFGFVLLDELGTVKGWHDPSESGIYANEVRDTREGLLVVKSFKGGTIAEGLYKDIKDRVAAAGGQFVANCYIAFKRGDEMAIGSIQFKGSALGAWMDFRKANRGELYKKAVEIHGFTEGKKGKVVFRVPQFRLREMSDASNEIAIELDKELQAFLTAYLQRTKRDQVDVAAAQPHQPPAPDGGYRSEYDDRQYDADRTVEDNAPFVATDDDLPF